MVQELQTLRDLLHRSAAGMPLVDIWPTPASFYSFWDVTRCFGKRTPEGERISTSDDIAAYLVRCAGVVTALGRVFMQDGFLRLSFATPEHEIAAGMAAAKAALGELV